MKPISLLFTLLALFAASALGAPVFDHQIPRTLECPQVICYGYIDPQTGLVKCTSPCCCYRPIDQRT